jgi:hypothetical protein
VRHAAPTEAGEVIGLQKLRVADLHRVAEFRRQRGEERVQALQKLAKFGETALRKRAELEDEQ